MSHPDAAIKAIIIEDDLLRHVAKVASSGFGVSHERCNGYSGVTEVIGDAGEAVA
jgi:hypothetical protein